jgi:Icc-related predicted phosphoesterase
MRLGILTDIHIAPTGNHADAWHNPHQFDTARQRLADSIAWLEQQGIDRLAVLGDLTHHGDDTSLRETLAIIANATVPVWVLPGNHDLGHGPSTLADALASNGHTHVEVIGSDPVPFGDTWQVVGTGLAKSTGGGYEATPEPDSTSWSDAPTVVLSHFPLISLRDACTEAGLKYAGDLVNGSEIVARLAARLAPVLVVNGHLHVRHAATQGAVLQAACGAQVESLFEATLIDLNEWPEGIVRWTSTAIQPPWEGPDPALSPDAESWRWSGSAWQQTQR